jgi:predicted alpha/beta hydrolase family esterase
MHFVIVPGINGSDENHWQSMWQAEWGPAASRIVPASWDEPDLDDWCQALDRAVAGATDVVLVAHSLGCITAIEWAARARPAVRGMFLVAPPDTARADFPAEASTFVALTPVPLEVPGLLVTSDDDPYCTTEASGQLAKDWGVDHVDVGRAGHINSASGLGRWEFGHALLTAFTAGTGR